MDKNSSNKLLKEFVRQTMKEYFTKLDGHPVDRVYDLVIGDTFIIYIFLFSYFLIFFTSFFQLKVLIFIILAGCIASDLGGYIFGKLIQIPEILTVKEIFQFDLV